jgi:hypothetical protein
VGPGSTGWDWGRIGPDWGRIGGRAGSDWRSDWVGLKVGLRLKKVEQIGQGQTAESNPIQPRPTLFNLPKLSTLTCSTFQILSNVPDLFVNPGESVHPVQNQVERRNSKSREETQRSLTCSFPRLQFSCVEFLNFEFSQILAFPTSCSVVRKLSHKMSGAKIKEMNLKETIF